MLESSTIVGNDRLMSEAIVEMWKQAHVNASVEIIEASVRAQKNRDKSFKGLFWSDASSTLQDPDGMMYRLLGAGRPAGLLARLRVGQAREGARFSLNATSREAAYKRMQEIMDVNLPWIPVIIPIESHGVASYVTWRSNPNQTMELRKEVFSFKVVGIHTSPSPPPRGQRRDGCRNPTQA